MSKLLIVSLCCLFVMSHSVAQPAYDKTKDSADINITADAYMQCGRDYVQRAPISSVSGAVAACQAKFDAHGAAWHKLALNTQLSEGRDPKRAEAFANLREKAARKDIKEVFMHMVKTRIEDRAIKLP